MNDEARDAHGRYDHPTEEELTPDLMGVNTLIGNVVVNHKDQNIGKIKDIMLDMRTGRICYAVLSFGGFFGLGEKLFATPWTALRRDTTNTRFILNVERESLVKTPGFDKEKWPDRADQSWSKEMHAYLGIVLDPETISA